MGRKENLITLGFMVVGGVGIYHHIHESQREQPGAINTIDALDYLKENAPNLLPVERLFIAERMSQYLSHHDLEMIVGMSQSCTGKDESGKPKRLVLFGVPIFNEQGYIESFLPKAVACGREVRSNGVTRDLPVTVPSLEAQLLRIASGDNYNTVAMDKNYGGDSRLHYNFQEQPLVTKVPQYTIDLETGTLNTAEWPVKASTPLMEDQDFAWWMRKIYEEKGLCAFINPYVGQTRSKSQEHSFSFTSQETNEKWTLNICENTFKGRAITPTSYNVNTFPVDIQKSLEKLFQHAFPLGLSANHEMTAAVNQDGKEYTLTLFREAPAATSITVGYREGQMKPLSKYVEPISISPSLALGLLTEMLALGMLAEPIVKKLNKKKKERTAEEELAEKEEVKKRMKASWEAQRKQQPVAPKVEGRKIESSSEKFVPFTWKIGEESFEIANLNTNDVLSALVEIIGVEPGTELRRANILKRLYSSRKEVSELFAHVTQVTDDFTKIQAFLDSIAKRVTVDNVGGESVSLSYQIINQQGNFRDVLGHLYIDFDVIDRELEVVFLEGPMTVAEHNIKEAEETPLEDMIAGQEVDTVKEAADLIFAKIMDLLTAENLFEVEFNALRQDCRALVAKHRAYSLVKKEVIRQLAEELKSEENKIPIACESIQTKKSAPHYVRVIADRIFDYIDGINTNATEFENFTDNARNWLERNGYEPHPSTAGKVWVTRTGYRAQIVQATKDGNKQIVILFTDNDH